MRELMMINMPRLDLAPPPQEPADPGSLWTLGLIAAVAVIAAVVLIWRASRKKHDAPKSAGREKNKPST